MTTSRYLVLCSAMSAFAFTSLAQAATTERVSVASDGTQGNGASVAPSVSADGRYVAFESSADNLVLGDTNGVRDIFVHDRMTGQTERVSVASDGTQGNGGSQWPSISADGQYVAFASDAGNLVPGDTNAATDVFVHDRMTGETVRVSVASDGTQGNSRSWWARVSADGGHVAFHSVASNLVLGDTNGQDDAFVHDRMTGQTEAVSVSSDGTPRGIGGVPVDISADGRYVAFESYSAELVPDDTNNREDAFVHDRVTGQTERVSVASDGSEARNGGSSSSSISADGRWVAIHSYADNLVSGDTNGQEDAFVHDRVTGQTVRVSVSSDGIQGDRQSDWPVISADGRWVAFPSRATNLVPGDTNAQWDTFVHDRVTGQTSAVTVSGGGIPGGGEQAWPAISADGSCVAFQSGASSLVTGDTNGITDAFVAVLTPETGALFAAMPLVGPMPLEVSFTDYSTDNPVSWSWDFGDGATSTQQNPTHQYTDVGRYTVSLSVTTDLGPDTRTWEDCILVHFADVGPGHWALDHVLACVDGDVVKGYGDGTYHPELAVTRDQMAVYVSRALADGDENVPEFTGTPTFPDVPEGFWALKYVEYAVSQNVVAGYQDGSYHPERQVTRDQMAVYVARSICDPTGEDGLADYVPADPRNFPDVPSGFWSYKHVECCVENGVVQGYGDGLYHPEMVVTRDQMAVYVARAFGLL